jgi:hypothetical protein
MIVKTISGMAMKTLMERTSTRCWVSSSAALEISARNALKQMRVAAAKTRASVDPELNPDVAHAVHHQKQKSKILFWWQTTQKPKKK